MEQAAPSLPRKRFPPILPGNRYGRLTAVSQVSAGRRPRWRFKCDCGNEAITDASRVKAGGAKSCGCLKRDARTHGHHRRGRRASEYLSWAAMIQRCTNPNCDVFHNYGGRGITVCERWRSYENFYADMGPRPSPRHSLDRIDNDKGYEPGNVRWATRQVQNRNNRRTRLVMFQGQEMCLMDACRMAGIRHTTARGRLAKGWSVEDALTEPPLTSAETAALARSARGRRHESLVVFRPVI